MTHVANSLPDGFESVVHLPLRSERRVASTLRLSGTNDLMSTTFAPIRWVVDGYLPEGFAVLAGRQKLGKTWLAIDIAIAVATGGLAMGTTQVASGDVLYIDFENGDRRIQRRIRRIFPSDAHRPDLRRLNWCHEAPALNKGLLQALEEWRLSVEQPRLVIIDVLQRIKPIGSVARTSYENDYSAWAPLQSWAMQQGVAVLGLHHLRKAAADDPLEALNGSNGLAACADTTLVLNRDGNGITLYVRGRDVDEKESALTFCDGLWSLTGDAAKVRMTSERLAVVEALTKASEPLGPHDVADATGMSYQNARQALSRMSRAGEIERAGRGRYQPLTVDAMSQASQGHQGGSDAR